MKTTKNNKTLVNALNILLVTCKKLQTQYDAYKAIKSIQIHSLTQYASVGFMSKKDFYNFSQPVQSRFIMKSRMNEKGQTPFLPLTSFDFDQLVAFEAYKFQVCGVQAGDTCSVINIPLDHTIPMTLALMKLHTTFYALDGDEAIIFESIIKHKLSVLFTTPGFIERFISYVKKKRKKISIRLVITAGGAIPNLKTFGKQVKKYFGAAHIDNIGSRELSSYAISCPTHHVYHFLDTYQYVEIIDPYTHLTSSTGEIIITPLWRKNFPMIRFRTSDIVAMKPREACMCPIKGSNVFTGIIKRLDNSIKVGMESFMSAKNLYTVMEHALLYQYPFDTMLWSLASKPSFILIISTNKNNGDLYLFIDKISFRLSLRTKRRLTQLSSRICGIGPKVCFAEKKDIEALAHTRGFIDLRYAKKSTTPQTVLAFLKKYSVNIF